MEETITHMNDLASSRRALFIAVRALSAHRDSLVLVGAHAVQEWAGAFDGEIGGSPATKDADLQIDTSLLGADPRLEVAMTGALFAQGKQPGIWLSKDGVQVDLLVAEAQAGARGRRAGHVPGHHPDSMRRTEGLEACLVLNERRTIRLLDSPADEAIEIRVAKPPALIVAKAFKLGERLERGEEKRMRAKDALDVLRLLRCVPTVELVGSFETLVSSPICGRTAARARGYLAALFGEATSPGCRLLRAEYEERGAELAGSIQLLTHDLLVGASKLAGR